MAKKVLLIEDSTLDADVVGEVIANDGFEMHIARTAKEGLEKAEDVKPDLILLDILLPDGNGFDICKSIRQKGEWGKKVLIVMLSIKSDRKDIEKAFEMGADDYIIKPPAPEFLLKKVKLYLRA